METLEDKIKRKKVTYDDAVYFKEADHYSEKTQKYVYVPQKGYLLAKYVTTNNETIYIVSNGEITSCVVRHIRKVFSDKVACYADIVANGEDGE